MAAVIAVLVIFFGANISVGIARRMMLRRGKVDAADLAGDGVVIGFAAIDTLLIGIVVFLLCSLEPDWTFRIFIILFGLLLDLFLVAFLGSWFNWKGMLAVFAGVLVTAAGIVGYAYYMIYLEKITVPDHFDYMTFTPFMEDSLVLKPDEEPSLRFDDEDTLPRMDGATALYPVYAAFAQAVYPESLKDLEDVEKRSLVACSTTGTAYIHIVSGDCDIIFVAGPSEEQEKYAEEKGVQLVYTPIGQEAFVFFVHPDNPLDSITLDQIRSIYSGQTKRWSELGVKGLGKILAYQRTEGSGSQTALERYVMKDTPLMPATTEREVGSMGGIVEIVSPYRNHRNAIGYSFRFYCTALMKDFHVKLLAVNGVEPTLENIENGTYPLASCFYAVTRSDADENTLRLLEWICSPEGQAVVEKCGYSPLNTDK